MRLQIEEVIKLVPMVAVFVSIVTLLVSLRKDRNLRTKEYADRVRRSAALVAARADRWKHLSLSLYQDIQVAIADTDIILVKERDVRKADDFLWRELFIAQRAIARKITDEQIEIAYADLFGYDTNIHDLFGSLVQRLARAEKKLFVTLLKRTQDDIVGSYREDGSYVSTVLGNLLRKTAKEISLRCESLMESALVEFRREMIKIVEATDKDIARKRIAIRKSSEVFAEFDKISDFLFGIDRSAPPYRDGGTIKKEVGAVAQGPLDGEAGRDLQPVMRSEDDRGDEGKRAVHDDRGDVSPEEMPASGSSAIQGVASNAGGHKPTPSTNKKLQTTGPDVHLPGDRDPDPAIPSINFDLMMPPSRDSYDDDENQ